MFNGIIKNTGKIKKIIKKNNNCLLELNSNMSFKRSEIGSSISCSGVCLTLEKFIKRISTFYISKETLSKTIFSSAKVNDIINMEKSLKFGQRLSGHFVQGHIDTTSKIKRITHVGKSWLVDFKLPNRYKKYIIPKGSITINGVSLTVTKLLGYGFQVSLVPHTLKHTNLIYLKEKEEVKVELDVLGKYIKHYIK